MNYLRMSGMVAGRSYSGSAIAINRNSNKMASALVAITLAAGTLVQAQVQPTTTTATNDPSKTEHVKMEKFEVTGSRIKRLDTETPQPVVTFSSEEIKMGGFTSLGDFVQSLPFNTGSTNSIVQTASFTRGAATV
ncbi:MAG TPA: hypothetical protein PLV87_14535, partial [Opitutaceae bacterium]|nr:hypothetical protein [Opitutaceae bacterium]